MALNDTAVSIILGCKTLGDKPTIGEIDTTNYTSKALWYQWDNLVVNDGVLYRKCNDVKGNVIFQLVAPAKIRNFFFSNLHCSCTFWWRSDDRSYSTSILLAGYEEGRQSLGIKVRYMCQI